MVNGVDVLFRDNQEMERGLGLDVSERDKLAVLKDNLCWHFFPCYFAKQAILHKKMSNVKKFCRLNFGFYLEFGFCHLDLSLRRFLNSSITFAIFTVCCSPVSIFRITMAPSSTSRCPRIKVYSTSSLSALASCVLKESRPRDSAMGILAFLNSSRSFKLLFFGRSPSCARNTLGPGISAGGNPLSFIAAMMRSTPAAAPVAGTSFPPKSRTKLSYLPPPTKALREITSSFCSWTAVSEKISNTVLV